MLTICSSFDLQIKPKHLKGAHINIPNSSLSTAIVKDDSSASSSSDSDSDSSLPAHPTSSATKKSKKSAQPSAPADSAPTRVGVLDRKEKVYDIWSLPAVSPHEANARNQSEGDGADGIEAAGARAAMVEGEELRTLNVLLPRGKKNGKLYLGASLSRLYM